MQSPDIHIVISSLASLYDELNKHWGNDTCMTDVYQVYRQKEYRDVYEQLKDVNIESIALKIIADSVSDKVLIRLRELIRDNIQIYETRQDAFNGIIFDKLYSLWEDYLFVDKHTLLLKDRETITNYPYPSERERELLLKENQQDINELDNERNNLRRADAAWIGRNYYSLIYELSRSFTSILDSYFPGEKEKIPELKSITTDTEIISNSELQSEIEPDMIFRTRMFDKLLTLEKKLIEDKYLNPELYWISVHDNGKPDIKSLITFLVGLLDNRYFLPGKNPKIRKFFENRYQIKIGQNFEVQRRNQYLEEYKNVFFEYRF